CQIMSKGVVAVLGPSASPASNSIISNICGEKEVSPCAPWAGSPHSHLDHK
ncbi:Glutamate receptor ionotropic, kainate 4, partial [Xenoophorus captivus]